MAVTDDAIPVHVLTGYLGAGKTTLLNRLLRDPAWADTAVIVNEFGEVGLDHLLVDQAADQVVLLDSGCLCCAASDSLRETLADLYRRRASGELPRFRRVLVETSGLADPAPVLQTLLRDPLLKGRYSARALICVVDAVHGMAAAKEPEAQAQIAMADRIVISKTDLSDARPQALASWLKAMNPDAVLVTGKEISDDPASLTGGDEPVTFVAAVEPGHSHGPHGSPISFSFRRATPVEFAGVAAWTSHLRARWGDRLLRVKALLPMANGESVLIQGVRTSFDISRRGEGTDAGRIVLIGRDLDRSSVERGLAWLDTAAGMTSLAGPDFPEDECP